MFLKVSNRKILNAFKTLIGQTLENMLEAVVIDQ